MAETGACPRCAVPLLPSDGVHACPERHGAFVPDARLREHVKTEHLPRAAGSASIGCPSCGTMMQEIPVQDLLIDRCPGCGGWWMDLGELEALRAALPTQPSDDERATWWRAIVEAVLYVPWLVQ